MKGEGKKLRAIWYGPFTILDKIGNNSFRLDLLISMLMYSVENVENINLYEIPLIMNTNGMGTVPIFDEFSREYLDELP